jgi:hypothetical protein
MVQANPNSGVVQGIRQKLEMMPAQQLAQVAKTSSSEEVRAMALEILREKQIREQAESQAQQSIMQDQQRGLPTPITERAGLPAAPAGSMDMLNAASGGIVAFAGDTDGSQVELDLEKEFAARQKAAEFAKRQREAAGIGAPKAAMADYYAQEKADIAEATKQKKGYDLLNFGLNLATEAGSLPYAASRAGQKTLPAMIAREDELRGRRGNLAKGLAEIAEGERLVKAGDIEAGNAMIEKGNERNNRLKIAEMQNKASMASANRPDSIDKSEKIFLKQMIDAGSPDNADTRAAARQKALAASGMAGPKLGVNMEAKIGAEHAKINSAYETKLLMAETDAERKQLLAERQAEKDAVTKRYNDAARLVSDESPTGGPSGANPVVVDGYQFPDQASADKYLEAKKKKK